MVAQAYNEEAVGTAGDAELARQMARFMRICAQVRMEQQQPDEFELTGKPMAIFGPLPEVD